MNFNGSSNYAAATAPLYASLSPYALLVAGNHSTTISPIAPPANITSVNNSLTRQMEKIFIYCILFIIASIGNTTAFVALLFMNKPNLKSSKARIRLLLMNLCIADLIVTYIDMPLEIVWAITDRWLAGEIVCKLMMFLRTFGLYLSSFVLITITIDRYYVIVKPLEVEKVYRLNKVLILCSWIFSFISSIPQVIVFEVLTHPNDKTFKQCVTFGKFMSQRLKLIYNLYHFVGCYALPLIIMLYCYAKIFLTIKWHSNSSTSGNDEGSLRIKSFKCGSNRSNQAEDDKSKSINEQIEHLYGEKCDYMDENRSKLSEKKLIRKEVKSVIKKQELRKNEDSFIRRNTNNTFRRAKYKTLKLSILIVIAFLFCWTPYYFCSLWAIVDEKSFLKYVNQRVKNYLLAFAVSNSCFNSIIYGVFSNKLYQFLPCLKCKNDLKSKSNSKYNQPITSRTKYNRSTPVFRERNLARTISNVR